MLGWWYLLTTLRYFHYYGAAYKIKYLPATLKYFYIFRGPLWRFGTPLGRIEVENLQFYFSKHGVYLSQAASRSSDTLIFRYYADFVLNHRAPRGKRRQMPTLT